MVRTDNDVKEETKEEVKQEDNKYIAVPRVVSQEEMLNLIYDMVNQNNQLLKLIKKDWLIVLD